VSACRLNISLRILMRGASVRVTFVITFTPHVALSVCVREIGHSLANKLEMGIEPKPN